MRVPFQAWTLALAGTLICTGCQRESGATARSSFESPGAAAQEFAEAVRKGDKASMAAILGPDSGPLLNPGDTVAGGNERKAFIMAYDNQRLLVPAGPEAFTLEVGATRWPLPLPIVTDGESWKFDAKGGMRELVLRRISPTGSSMSRPAVLHPLAGSEVFSCHLASSSRTSTCAER